MTPQEKYALCSDERKWIFNGAKAIKSRMMMNEKDLIKLTDVGK